MSKLSSTIIDECSLSQLKTLLALAMREPGVHSDLTAQAANRAELSRLLAELCRGEPDAGELLFTSVCEPETPVEALRGIKELAKGLVAEAKTDAQRNAATFLYHAATAAAFSRHGVEISSRSLSARSALYEDLAAVLAGDPLGQVFRQAFERALETKTA